MEAVLKTYVAKKETVERKWYVVDATDKPLGRLATQVAQVLRGKNKPDYTPHVDTGDYVVVINSAKVKLSGSKEETKEYFSHSTYMGGSRFRSYKEMQEKAPEKIVEYAVKGMVSKTKLGRAVIKKLFVYTGTDHKHLAQKPEVLELKY